MRKKPASPRPIALAVFSILGLAPVAVLAQEAVQQATEQPLEEVTVTGSRIARPETAFANPVVSLSADSIKLSGKTNVAEILAESPALVGSTTGGLTGGNSSALGQTGLNLLNLRNLGADRTLVLVDGRRHVSGLAGSAAVDTSAIPTDLIESVDVLTGGASAIYGADGVSGVVNFRMKKDFEGITTRAQIGQSRYGDGANRFGALTWGQNFSDGRGNIAFAYEYNSDDRVFSLQRPWLRQQNRRGLYQNQADLDDDPNVPDNIVYQNVGFADTSPEGGVDVDFDDLSDFEGNGRIWDPGTRLIGSGGYAVGGSNTPFTGYDGDLFPKLERNLANLIGHYDFSDRFSIFFEGKYVSAKAMTLKQPTFDSFLFIPADNPFIPQSIRDAILPGAAADFFGEGTADGVNISRDSFDAGMNGEEVTRDTLRGVIGASGALSDHAKYEISYVYGETRSRIVNINNRINARWFAAIDAVTDPSSGNPICRSSLDPDADPDLAGCVPFNIFGSQAHPDPAALAFININSVNHSLVSQSVVSGSISGNFGSFLQLPGGSVGYAIGAEYRRETSEFRPDARVEAGDTFWTGALLPSDGAFSVKEVFSEIALPVLEDQPFAKTLSFGGAVRLSDYTSIGKTTTWKVDSVYAPLQSVSFRGTYSQAVRAPNINELFAPSNAGFAFIDDPCDFRRLNNGSATRAANCAAILESLGIDPATFSPSTSPLASVSIEGIAGGNPNLSEETAKTWTAGVVLRPSFIPAFTMTLDWYDIEIKKAINTATAEQVANLCVDQPTLANPFCDAITRGSNNGFIAGWVSQPENVANFTTAGLDITMAYELATENLGTFEFRLLGGYLHRLTSIATPGAEVVSDVNQSNPTASSGGPAPEKIAKLDVTWMNGSWTLAYNVEWFSKTLRYATNVTAGDPDYVARKHFFFKEKWEHSLQADYQFSEGLSAYVGVNNLFNEKPQFDQLSYPVSAMGAFYYGGVRASF
jgi:iron complex outermembrane recepter protein